MSRTLVCSPPARLAAAVVVAHSSSVGSEGGKTRSPNLDSWDKLVKRGLLVSWCGYRGEVQRVRTGRCLVRFLSYSCGPAPRWSDDPPQWLSCRSVTVVAP